MDTTDHIEKISSNLSCILEKLEGLDYDNFDRSIAFINDAISDTKENKNILLENDQQFFLENNKTINIITKKIKIKLDNIIEKRELELEAVSKKLNNLNNQKKLVLYKR